VIKKTLGTVHVTTSNFLHDKCNPSIITYQAIYKMSHSKFFEVPDEIKQIISCLLYTDRNIPSISLKSIIQPYIPSGIYLSPQCILNIRNRILKQLPTVQSQFSLENFKTNVLKDDDQVWKNIKLFNHIDNADAVTIAENVSKDFEQNEDDDMHAVDLFFANLKQKDPSLQYAVRKKRGECIQGYVG